MAKAPLAIRNLFTLCAITAVLAGAGMAQASERDDTGYTRLLQLLPPGAPAPGTGVPVTQVEATNGQGLYQPDDSIGEFAGKTITLESGDLTPSSHATTVGRHFYGNDTSLAPGVSQIYAWEANLWLYHVLQYTFNAAPLPRHTDAKVINHSWVGYNSDTTAVSILRRADYLAEGYGMTLVGGVNNPDPQNPDLPTLLAATYNGIAVGREDLLHSPGPTTLDVAGRAKPDIFAPETTTSWATGLVSSAAALLIGDAESRGWTDAARPEVVKSLLMAGARKHAGWSNAPGQPLDLAQGAGGLQIDQSWMILDAGESDPPPSPDFPLGDRGWDFGQVTTGQPLEYFIRLEEDVADLTINLTWLRRHAGPWRKNVAPAVTLDDLNLYLHDEAGGVIASSQSAIDNVEHIWLPGLSAGDYRITVTLDDDQGDVGEAFGLAWFGRINDGDFDRNGVIELDDINMMLTQLGDPYFDLDGDHDSDADDVDLWVHTVANTEYGDLDLDGSVSFLEAATVVANIGLTPALYEDGDLDGNATVDTWEAQAAVDSLGPAGAMLVVSSNGMIPEPTAAAMMLPALGLLLRRKR